MSKYGDAGGTTGQADKLPNGNYQGHYVSHEWVASAKTGTPGFKFVFAVDGLDEPVAVSLWLSENDFAVELNTKALQIMGWNGGYADAAFTPVDPVPLWLKYQTEGKYAGNPQWNISTFVKRDPPPPGDPKLRNFAARFKAMSGSATAKPPVTPKTTAAPTPRTPAPPPPTASAPPPPSTWPDGEMIARTQDEAWDAWVKAKADTDGGKGFWQAVKDSVGHTNSEKVTAEQWNDVACMAPPM